MIDCNEKSEPTRPTRVTTEPRDAPYVFEPNTLRRQLMRDAQIRWIISFVAISCLLLAMMTQPFGATGLTLMALVALAAWFYVGMIGSRTAQQIPQITLLIEQNPPAGELKLARALGQRVLPKSLRLVLYHRLAMLRYHQQRYDKVTIICPLLLGEMSLYAQKPWIGTRDRTGPMSDPVTGVGHEQLTRHLLFMLVDASLQSHRLTDAYLALVGLHHCQLRLADLLQLLLLQTRYEVAAGYATRSLHRVHQKVALAELMPIAHCATMHALLAIGAQQSRQIEKYDWLKSRADLFCESDQWHAASPIRLT